MKGPLKTHGGKHYLAQKIMALMPPHTHFVEPFAGGLAVLLAKECEGISEVVNDLDGNFTNFWQVLQDEGCSPSFSAACRRPRSAKWNGRRRSKLSMTPKTAWIGPSLFFILCRQSMSGRVRRSAL